MSPAASTPGLRVDAARNLDRIVAAAGDAFEELGRDVALEEIARRAGVGVATVYRRFGNRDGLVRAVVERAFRDGTAALAASDDAWADLTGLLTAVVEAFAAHRVALVLAKGVFDVGTIEAYLAVLDAPLQRARAAGVVRPELVARDLAAVVIMALSVASTGPASYTGGGDSGRAATSDRRRYLALLTDALRPGSPTLPG